MISRDANSSSRRLDPPAALDTKARARTAQRAAKTQDRRPARRIVRAAPAAVTGAACVLACALASGCGRAPAHEATTGSDTTVTFQSGVGGYTALADGAILSVNGGNGVSDFADDQAMMLVNTVDSYEAEAMIRFGGLGLPAGAQITSASVTLTFEDFFAGSRLRGYYLKAAWSPPPANLGWQNRDTGLAWNTPGAKGIGSDVVAGVSFTDTNFPGTGNLTRTYPLDTATVQGWITNPATNQGILLVNEIPDRTLRVFTSEHATVTNRPLLTLNYTTDGGGGGTGCVTANFDQWMNQAFTAQTGSFTSEFDATPSVSNIDGVIALSNGPQTTYPGLAVIPRFNPAGFIDARNGGAYAAVASIPYTGGVAYHFRVVVDIASHTYSVFVRSGGGAEQTVATSYAFRTEQATVTPLNNWVAYVDSAGGSLQVCNFVVSGGGGGSPPTGSMTAPANNATVSGTAVTVSATASDSVGVAGVQFLLDGQSLNAEDTTGPYSIVWDSTTASNAGHALSARIRNTGGLTTVTSAVNVTVSNAVSTAAHPRIWLDTPALASLTERAQAGDAAWTRLRNKCQSWAGGTVQSPPSGRVCESPESQCNAPDICCGYQGFWYYDAVLDNSLCYQVGKAIGDPQTTAWGNKAVAVLNEMSKFDFYQGDSGYGIRNFGIGMAIGFDWLYPLLSPTLKTAVVSRLNGWNTWYDSNGLSHATAPLGNYFAGYYAAKAYIGLATEGDNTSAAATWSDFLTRLHRGGPGTFGPDNVGTHAGVASYYTTNIDGGGYPEGWEYGNLAVRNMAEPMLAARTAKGLDLINDAGHPYHYPLNSSSALIASMWPSMQYMDDRDLIHGVSEDQCPGDAVLTTDTAVSLSALLRRWGDPRASQFQSWVRTVRNLHPSQAPWLDFLFWDDRNPPAGPDYTTLPRSYLSRSPTPQGTNYAMMRSDWTTSASWASLRAMAYMDAQDQSHEFPDAGALAITRGDTPFLVNPGFLDRCYTGTSAEHDNEVEGDAIRGAAQNFNTFYTSATDGQHWYDIVIDRSPAPRTTIGRFEDRNGYVLSRAEHLEDVYVSSLNVAAWSRTVVYLRPRIFVVYDRTTTTGTVAARMSWHFPPQPTQVTAPSGTSRWDVNDSALPAPEGGFKGALTTLLPQSAPTVRVDVDGLHKLYRVEVRPASPATDLRWLTVLDTSTTSAGVAAASVPASLSANARGTRLTWSGGNAVVLFGAGATDTPLTGTVSFVEPAAATTLIVADLQPGASYSVTAAVSGGNHSVTIQPGSGFQASDQGTLYVVIAASGAVSAGT